jgi:hypothetical protein
MSRSRTSHQCSSGLVIDKRRSAKVTTLLRLRDTYIDIKSGQGCRVPFTFRKGETPDSSARPRLREIPFAILSPPSLAVYRRKPSLFLPSILAKLLVVSQFTRSKDIAFHTLVSWLSYSLSSSNLRKTSLPTPVSRCRTRTRRSQSPSAVVGSVVFPSPSASSATRTSACTSTSLRPHSPRSVLASRLAPTPCRP